jgi:hypothetical protein
LPDGATVCPACDEPVAKAKTKRTPKPPAEAAAPGAEPPAEGERRDSEAVKPETTPSNDAMLAATAGVVSVAFAFFPCFCGVLWGSPLSLVAAAAGVLGIAKGTHELDAIKRGDSPEAGQKPANIGRLSGFVGIALTALNLAAAFAWSLIVSKVKRH